METEAMTLEQARRVRELRVKHFTWREVAALLTVEWGREPSSNQLLGMEICREAAGLLGEDYMAPPWN